MIVLLHTSQLHAFRDAVKEMNLDYEIKDHREDKLTIDLYCMNTPTNLLMLGISTGVRIAMKIQEDHRIDYQNFLNTLK